MSHPLPDPSHLKPADAWEPLPITLWNEDTVAHFLRRAGFAATPEAVESARAKRPIEAIKDAFENSEPLSASEELLEFKNTSPERRRSINRDISDPEEKRKLRNELRKEEQELFRHFALSWFRHASAPENSATEKFVLFLQDIFVVGRQKIQDSARLFSMHSILRDGMQKNYPELCKQVSREPAMILYLDLNRSSAKKPNENFARELFELFTLGEGNYREQDIKEAARAFTGYRVRNQYEFFFGRNHHDSGVKTVFEQTGAWTGDEVIDITFEQPAARTFMIREMVKFYLSDVPLDEAYLVELGDRWAAQNFSIRYLIETFFGSILFYHPAFRGNLVKSPVHFYLGLCQDLRIDVLPFENRLLRSMDAMGQSFFNPPNVRGWLYGENWINSTTINARRQLVEYVFSELNEEKLNGNEQQELQNARDAGLGDFLVTPERLSQLEALGYDQMAAHLIQYFITGPSRASYGPALRSVLSDDFSDRDEMIRNAIIALLQAPAYNLC